VEVLNPRLNLWKTNVLGFLTTPRDSFGVAVVDGTIYTIGGKNTQSGSTTTNVLGTVEGIVGCF